MEKEKFLDENMINEELDRLNIDGREFWKTLILQRIETNNDNNEEQIKVTMEQVEEIIDNVLENDYLWDVLESEVMNEISAVTGTELDDDEWEED